MKIKKFCVCVVVIALFVCAFMSIPFTTVRAAEIEITPIEDVQPIEIDETDNTDEDLSTISDKLNMLIGKYNAEIETAKNFFISRVLPAIIASAISALFGIVFGVKGYKSRTEYLNKYNQAAKEYNVLEAKFAEYKKQSAIEQGKLEQYQADLLPTIIAQNKKISELENQIATLTDNQNRLIYGAAQAWAECPDAIRELCRGAEKGTNDDEN